MVLKPMFHFLQTFWIDYMDQIAEKIGVRPNLLSLFLRDPYLSARCYFGPCLPSQYRLGGPGKWNGAKRCIQGAISRCMTPSHKGLQPMNFIRSKTLKSTSPLLFSLTSSCFCSVFFSYVFFL